jgi:acyl dehydratase
MSLRPDLAGATSGPVTAEWDSTGAILYALGVGAGQQDPTADLEFTTENTMGVEQRALPVYAAVIAQTAPGLRVDWGEFDRSQLVHAEQAVLAHQTLPVSGSARLTSMVTGVYDKGSGTLVATETRAADPSTGAPLFTTRQASFIRGLRGVGSAGGGSPKWETPDQPPDATSTAATRPDQALLYRLSGDRNPLHSDPAYAARGGFAKPILHGLCTYGVTAHVLLRLLCEGDPARFASIYGRFSKPVRPGEQLTISVWSRGDTHLFQTADSNGDVVIDRGTFVTK